MRKPANVVDYEVHILERVLDVLPDGDRFERQFLIDGPQLELQHSQCLAQLVVQFHGNPSALFLLGLQQVRREQSKFFSGILECLLGELPFRIVNDDTFEIPRLPLGIAHHCPAGWCTAKP